ncbi:MAG TPA: LysR substrate-binding domain-containing protein [Alphaproteobacteria bacterium]|nr:LysR substrate-binding domain-containing protein [Alphaproteobacteria bacterium]
MRMPDLDIDLLRCFVAVAETGGFTAAGEALGRTQSAVSLKIKRLEDLLGRRVLERTSRSLALTEEGEVLLGYARRMLALNDETVRRLIEPEAEGHLRLGVAEYFVPHHLPLLLSQFARAYPRIHLTVRTGLSCELLDALDAGQLDAAIAKGVAERPQGRAILSEPLLWVAGPELALEPGRPVPLATLPPPCSFRHYAIAALTRAERAWEIVYTSASLLGVQAAVAANLAVAVVGRSNIQPGMRLLRPEDGFPALPDIEICLHTDEQARQPVLRPLVSFLLDTLPRVPRRAA